jgi:hypothetical protein
LFHPRTTIKADTESLELEAATPLAHRFVQSCWPHYDRLFRTSLKQAGTDVPFNSFVAITCLNIELQSLLLGVKTHLMLAEGIGIRTWDELANTYGQCFNLFNRTTSRRFENIVNVASGFPAMKGITMEVSRMMSPFMATTGNGTITVPVEEIPLAAQNSTKSSSSSFVTDALTKCELIIAILRSSYADEIAAMKRHMPYTLADSGFINTLPIVPDPFKTDGMLNSAISTINVSGNEGDAASFTNHLTMTSDAADVGFLPYTLEVSEADSAIAHKYTVFPDAIPFGSLMSSEIYIEDSDVTDKEFTLLTPHIIGAVSIPGTNTAYTGINFTAYTNHGLDFSVFYLQEALSLQWVYYDSETFWLPDGHPVNVDIDGLLSYLYNAFEVACDLPVVSRIDKLAQTSGAPVVNPAVHGER